MRAERIGRGGRKPREGGAVRVNEILTGSRRAGFWQYIVRMYGGFAIFCVANASATRVASSAAKKKSEIVNLKN
jgi:hypothetical protein